MSKWYKIAALAIAAIAVLVLLYALLTPEPADTTNHMGMFGHDTYSTQNVGLIAISIVVIVLSLSIVLFWNRYEPLPSSMTPTTPHSTVDDGRRTAPEFAVRESVENVDVDERAAHNYLVLRLLSGDERIMYKALMDSGGEALQKDLIQRTRMSNAKVSRLLDRLVEKDIVVKERYGATNKVRIKLDR